MRKKTKTVSRTVFDDVYRTIATKMPWLLIPVINEVFGTNYRETEVIVQLRNEFMEKNGKIITDSIFQIGGHIYHIECQSRSDTKMEIRMIEYDFAIALEHASKEDGIYTIRFPESCILYVRRGKSRPDKHDVRVVFPGDREVIYETKAVEVQDYSLDEIFEKKLLLYLPYYIVRYSSQFARIEKSGKRTNELFDEMKEIRLRLEEAATEDEKSDVYDDLITLILKVSDHMLRNNGKLRKGVDSIMGGKVLTLPSDKIRRAENRARKAALAEGRAEGKIDILVSLVKDNLLTVAEAASRLGESEAAFEARLKKS